MTSLYSFISCGQNLENELSVGQHCIFQHLCTWYVTKLYTWLSVHKIGSLRTNCKCFLCRADALAALFSRKTVSVLDSSLGRCFGRLFPNKLNVTAGSVSRVSATSATNRPDSAKHIIIRTQATKTAVTQCNATPDTTPCPVHKHVYRGDTPAQR